MDFRCQEIDCHIKFGETDEDGNLVFESSRLEIGFIVEKGFVICKNKKKHKMHENLKYRFDKPEKE